ncbi:hypothetical protein F5146DRAFT_1006308 [Armillaria mellea]|nr:hypothetical protein F5146DRAFT_1006308 [Armillaria mellea]
MAVEATLAIHQGGRSRLSMQNRALQDLHPRSYAARQYGATPSDAGDPRPNERPLPRELRRTVMSPKHLPKVVAEQITSGWIASQATNPDIIESSTSRASGAQSTPTSKYPLVYGDFYPHRYR